MEPSVRLCFVCLGNICRSPTAEGVMRKLVAEAGLADRIAIDSAGTGDYHVGERPDRRSQQEARRRGVELTSVARQFTRADFDAFHYVIAMDRQNRKNLERLARGQAQRDKVHMLRAFEPGATAENAGDVPDPYFGGEDGFPEVFAICEAACAGLLRHLIDAHGL